MASQRLAVLAITSELPWPLTSGGHLRTFHLLRTTAEHYRVTLIAGVDASFHPELSRPLVEAGIEVRTVPLGARRILREAWQVGRAAVRREPYALYRRHDRRLMFEAVRQEVRHRPDVLYIDHLDSFIYRPLCSHRPALIDLHNVYSTLVMRSAPTYMWPLSAYVRREARLLGCIESRVAGHGDTLTAVSDSDAAYFRALGAHDVHVVPNGVDCAQYAHLSTGRRVSPPVLLYLGKMSWPPNVGAARFLVGQVLPRVRERFPQARVRIVGANPTPELLKLGLSSNVDVTGEVSDVKPYLEESSLMAVPLEIGGGTRLKILEAFAAGLPVVSTPVGCEGLDVTDGVHLKIAEISNFADAVLEVLSVPEKSLALAGRARTLAMTRYDWSRSGAILRTALDSALAAGPPAGRA